MSHNTTISNKNFALLVGAVVAILITCLLLAGCTTPRKAAVCFDKHKTEGAEYCQSRYPITPVTITKIRTVNGKPDTIVVAGPSYRVICDTLHLHDTTEIDCPPSITINHHDTTFVHDSTTVLDTRQHYFDLTALDDSHKISAKFEKQASTWKKVGIGFGLLAALLLVVIVMGIKGKI